jgi:hypothetical protein
MSSLSDFIGGALTGSKVYYTTTSETKTLVEHGGKDQIVYVRNSEGDFGEDISGIRKITSDFTVTVTVGGATPYAFAEILTQEV